MSAKKKKPNTEASKAKAKQKPTRKKTATTERRPAKKKPAKKKPAKRKTVKKKTSKKAATPKQLLPIAERRGMIDDPPGTSWLAVLVKGSAKAVAESLQNLDDVERVRNCTLSKLPAKPERGDFYILVQLKGHAWTHVLGRDFFDLNLAGMIAESTGKEVLAVGSEKHSEEFYQWWKRKKLIEEFGSETDDVNIDELVDRRDVYVPLLFYVEDRRLELVAIPEDVLERGAIQDIYFVTKKPTPQQLRRRTPDAASKALIEAIHANDLNQVRQAIQKGADVDIWPLERGDTPLAMAIERARPPQPLAMIEVLLAAGADPNDGGRFATVPIAGRNFAVSERSSMQIILTLIDRGADLNGRGDLGLSAIEWAASSGKLPALKMLLKLGADISHTSNVRKWSMNSSDFVENVDLITRVKAGLEYSRDPDSVQECINFLKRWKTKKLSAADLPEIEELLEEASDKLADFAKLVAEEKKRKKGRKRR